MNFQLVYYGKETEPDITKFDFIEKYAQQKESLKNMPIDVRLEFDVSENFPANTAAYCLIMHNRITEYNSVSGGLERL